jgi:Lar family restriction alleviation protein
MHPHDTSQGTNGQRVDDCPFCGSARADWQTDGPDIVYVRCYQCESTGPVHACPSEAVAAWNNRTPDRVAHIETRLKAWFAAKYPAGVTDYALLDKLNEEVDEYLSCGAESWRDTLSALEEAADVVIVLINTAAHYGHSLFDAIERKLSVIERRLNDPGYGRAKS